MMEDFAPWMTSFLHDWNMFVWTFANLVLLYVVVMLLVFVVGYYALFNPKATTAGRYIFRFFVSLISVVGLVCLGLFLDPQGSTRWNVLPNEIMLWRPTVRLIGYLYVAFSITSLAILLVMRKWFPHKLRTAEEHTLVKLRQEQHSI